MSVHQSGMVEPAMPMPSAMVMMGIMPESHTQTRSSQTSHSHTESRDTVNTVDGVNLNTLYTVSVASVGLNYTANRQQFPGPHNIAVPNNHNDNVHNHCQIPQSIISTVQTQQSETVRNAPGTVSLSHLHHDQVQQPPQQSPLQQQQQPTVVLSAAENTSAMASSYCKKPRKKKKEKRPKKMNTSKDKPKKQKQSNDGIGTISLLGKKGKTLDAQAREIALNVAEYFKREADLGQTILPLHSYQKRAAAATGISTATLRKLEGARREIKSERVAAEEMVEDPFPQLVIADSSFLDGTDSRHKCKKCLKSRKFFCYTCCTPNPQLQDKLPKVKLPIKIDIIKHQNEVDGKSTCPHAVILAPDDVTVYKFPCIPDYDKEKVVLVFPCKEASSLVDFLPVDPIVHANSSDSLTDPLNTMIHTTPTTSNSTTDSGLHTPHPEQVGTVVSYPDIAASSTFPDMTNVWISSYYPSTGSNPVTGFSYLQPVSLFQPTQQQQQEFAASGKREVQDDEEGANKRLRSGHAMPFERAVFIDCTWNQTKSIIKDERLRDLHRVEIQGHQTQFWRCQEGIPTTCLSTIEAIYYFVRELHEVMLGLTYLHEYDNLLFFFAYFYRKIREKYKGGRELKAYQRQRVDSGDAVI